MSRPHTPKKNETSHVTIRCNNKEFLFYLNENFSEIVSWTNSLPVCFGVAIHHVIFMSNHIHLLLTPSEDNLGYAMSYYLTNLSKYLNFKNKRKNHVFGSRYHPTIVEREKHLINLIRYIYQNPIRANMVDVSVKYPYSSYGFYAGLSSHGLILSPDSYTKKLFDFGVEGRKMWVQHVCQNLEEPDIRVMQQSLKRKRFSYSQRQIIELSQQETSLIV